jgi:hypothetical protein
MFALTLAVGLYGLDAEVRQSGAFALAGELGRFPPPAVVANNRRIAKEHLERLEAIRVMGPLAGDVPDWYLERQKFIVRAYTHIEDARCYMNDWQQTGAGSLDYENEWGGFGRDFQADVLREIESLKHLIGNEDYTFGKLPAPMPCMESVHK